MLKHDLNKIRRNSEDIKDYTTAKTQATEIFAKRKTEYHLDQSVVNKLKKHKENVLIIVFTAEWCPDCHRNIPVLELISQATGIETLTFGHIMRDAKSSTKKWAVPPSPQEVEEFNVTKIPYIVVLNKGGEVVGEIIENPPQGKTLEQTLLEIVSK
jgi:thiol-disulfide isomerase/thioredoxin